MSAIELWKGPHLSSLYQYVSNGGLELKSDGLEVNTAMGQYKYKYQYKFIYQEAAIQIDIL